MIIVKTPLRISFVGGGSDLRSFYTRKEGRVVSSSIDKFVYAIVKERFDEMIYINYSRKETVARVSDIRHDLVREAMRLTGVDKGVEITTLADIPSTGSGLGSSSSITVALLHALYTYQNVLVTAEQLARDACRIEIDILGKPIGRQDQYAAAYGGLNKFTFQSDGTVLQTPLRMTNASKRKISAVLLLYYTGIARSADPILAAQNANLQVAETFASVEKMVALVDPFVQALEAGDIPACSRMLDLNWELKQRMAAGISTPPIAELYTQAKRAGASAAKIVGAGGGGFLLLVVPREHQNAVLEALRAYRELPFMLEGGGSKVIFDDRSYSSK